MSDLIIDSGPTAVITINRPSSANSVTPKLTYELYDLLEELDEDESTHAVILTGAGRFFCSGADLTVLQTVNDQSGLDAVIDYLCDDWMPAVQRAFRRWWDIDKPTVAAVNGAATAGGCDLALLSDYRVAAPSARFGESYINLGILPVGGGAWLVPRFAGARGERLLLTGEIIDAETARAAGLVDELTDGDAVVRAKELTQAFEARSPAVLAAYKRAARQPHIDGLTQAMRVALDEDRRLLQLPEVQKSLAGVLARYASE